GRRVGQRGPRGRHLDIRHRAVHPCWQALPEDGHRALRDRLADEAVPVHAGSADRDKSVAGPGPVGLVGDAGDLDRGVALQGQVQRGRKVTQSHGRQTMRWPGAGPTNPARRSTRGPGTVSTRYELTQYFARNLALPESRLAG